MGVPTCFFIWIMAVLGFYELLFAAVSFLFLAPAEKSSGIIELRGYMENIEFIIRSELLRHSGRVYIIDCGAHSETLQIAQLLARSSNRLVLLHSDDAIPISCENIT